MISEVEQPKEKRSLSSEPPSLMSLPYEIIENILARISKWSYPNLSLVSKSFLSLLSSPQLYKTRSEIGTTEPCLYFCLESANHSSPQWYTLWMKPDETLTGTGTIHDYSLIPLPSAGLELRRYIVWPNRYFPRLGDSQTAVRLINVNPNALEGKLYVAAQINDYTYEPKDDTWKVTVERDPGFGRIVLPPYEGFQWGGKNS
ncbi:unnamed protein product [Arabidopsis thaliana]|uniref:(thale cress) hypothetical protein n=1 Tax=Arabidopsis thaliana TaxID=3702 RepID=A0A7G2FIR9_ARATH|nr:unnamed protein product [Arabidopsis thaliana]